MEVITLTEDIRIDRELPEGCTIKVETTSLVRVEWRCGDDVGGGTGPGVEGSVHDYGIYSISVTFIDGPPAGTLTLAVYAMNPDGSVSAIT